MDNILQYQQVLGTLASERAAEAQKEAEEVAEKQQRISEFTSPFEGPATEHLIELGKTKLKSFAKKAGVSEKKVQEYIDAYKEDGGVSGVVKKISNDANVVKNKVLEKVKQPLARVAKTVAKDEAQSIGSLPNDVFEQSVATIKSALKSSYEGLNDEGKAAFAKVMNENKKEVGDFDNKTEWLKDRLNTAQEQLEKIKAASADDDVIKSASRGYDVVYRKRRVIKAAGDDLEDSVSRPINSLRGVTTVYRASDEAEQQAQGFLSGIRNRVSKFVSSNTENLQQKATEGLDKAGEDVSDAIKNATRDERVGGLGKALKKSAEEGGEIDAEGGGPEDVGADIAGFLASVGVFLGGVFGARHVHEEAPKQIQNVSFQVGAMV
jgi:hypothetical protein